MLQSHGGPLRFTPCHPGADALVDAAAAAADAGNAANASSSYYRDPHDEPDGLLRWLERFADNVEAGKYVAQPIIPEGESGGGEMSMGLNLFPQKAVAPGAGGRPGDYTRAVTRGIEVVASVIFVPEQVSRHPEVNI